MAKRSQKRHIRYEKEQVGCMWAFISIFDFRHGRSTRKLLTDRRRPSRQVFGVGYALSQLQMLTNSNEKVQENYDGEERGATIVDAAKASVKELMEEEMFTEQDLKQQMSSADHEAKESESERRGRAKKNKKRRSKTSKSSCDIHWELDAAENNQDLEEKISKNLDLEVAVNELCRKIYQKSTGCVRHDWHNDGFDEKLVEAIKVFVDRRLTNAKSLTEDRRIDPSKEFIEALETSSSNKELILELLKEPNSLLMKHIADLEGAQLEKDEDSNSLTRPNLLDGELNNSNPSVPVAHKQRNFFRRRTKSQENILLKEDENCRTSNRIVILKPGPASLRGSEAEIKLRASLQSHNGLGTKVQTERIASQFSFTEIKRKLKHAMGKERHEVHSDDITERFPYEHQNSGNSEKGVVGEKGGWSSPNRNHFYNERIAKPPVCIKNKNKNCKPKDTETSIGNGTVEYPKQRVSNIYIEAKKHLSEMLSNGDKSEDFSTWQSPKTLGRILSLPEFNFSPICSPGRDKEHRFVTAQQRFSPYKNLHVVHDNTWQLKQENHVNCSRQTLNSPSSIPDNPEGNEQSCNSNSDVLGELNRAKAEESTLGSMRSEKSSDVDVVIEGDVAIEQTTDALDQKESKVLDISAEQCNSSAITDDENGALAEVCDEEESAQCLKLDSLEQDQLLSSPLTSPTSSSITKIVGDLYSGCERPERPSPVSVLEPLFTEDDISPASIKFQPDELPIQPLRIHFEEQFSSATNQDICAIACMEDEESAFEYVEAVLLASDLNWEEFLLRWLASDQILDPSLFDEIELFSNRPHHDQKLLFDCTNQVLEEVCERYFGYTPWVSFVKHNIRPIPRRKDLIREVWEGVEWSLLLHPSPSTLDQIIRKDLEKNGTWMNLRTDVESVGTDIQEAIFKELVAVTISSFVNENPEINSPVLPAELIEIE
ncbi:uncharacterized protein LOC130781350 [Actinidia eriantha]|uniref:uncharacterized protein LOC130781350 n=1 Tax=Actinidia eriantha TaxID=165200 RepID=UPI00258FF767|nr:uncharacterized protein LOC130781350 [Actinidia eriantha]XP_057496511.1 uncharacterized protein LOC130781350 [Actinidia eriantha]